MDLTYHWYRPAPGRTGHTWRLSGWAGEDRDNLQGRSRGRRGRRRGRRRDKDSRSPPPSTCPGGPAWCGAPAGCRSHWGPPSQSGGPVTSAGSTSSSPHLSPKLHLVFATFAFLSNILLFHFTANINLTSTASHLIVKSKVLSFLSISF